MKKNRRPLRALRFGFLHQLGDVDVSLTGCFHLYQVIEKGRCITHLTKLG